MKVKKFKGPIGRLNELNELKKKGKLVETVDSINFDEFVKDVSLNDSSYSPEYAEYLTYKKFKVLNHRKNEDEFIIKGPEGFSLKVHSYENQAVYGRAQFIMFKGWEDDKWFNILSKEIETIETR